MLTGQMIGREGRRGNDGDNGAVSDLSCFGFSSLLLFSLLTVSSSDFYHGNVAEIYRPG